MTDEDLHARDARLRDLLQKTAKREEILGREAFLEMPPALQNQMAVLQKQSEPKETTLEALMAAEQNLREYNAKLDDAFNLKRQIEGERGRRSRARRREATRGVVQVVVAAIVVGGSILFYRMKANAKAEECAARPACEAEGLCSGRLSFTPFGMECAAQGEDCRGARICSEQGMCSTQEGVCMARTAEDCQRSRLCVEQGLCSPFGGTCVAGSADDCRASRACHERGACLEVGGRCVAPAGFDTPAASASASTSATPTQGARPKAAPRLRARP